MPAGLRSRISNRGSTGSISESRKLRIITPAARTSPSPERRGQDGLCDLDYIRRDRNEGALYAGRSHHRSERRENQCQVVSESAVKKGSEVLIRPRIAASGISRAVHRLRFMRNHSM